MWFCLYYCFYCKSAGGFFSIFEYSRGCYVVHTAPACSLNQPQIVLEVARLSFLGILGVLFHLSPCLPVNVMKRDNQRESKRLTESLELEVREIPFSVSAVCLRSHVLLP